MKKEKTSKVFLEELAKTMNVSIACERANLSRQSVYHWMKIDRKFKLRVDEALGLGSESISDLAESKIIGHIRDGKLRACEYWLNNHRALYVKPRSADFWDKITGKDRVDEIQVRFYSRCEDVEKDRLAEKNGEELSNDGWIEKRSELIKRPNM